MADAYVIHAPADADAAQRLRLALDARGVDAVTGPPRAGAKAVIVLWSAAAAADAGVRNDAAAALARKALLGVTLAPFDPPAEFQAAPLHDLRAWPGGEGDAAFERLVQGLAALRGRPATAAVTRASRNRLAAPAILTLCIAAIAIVSIVFAARVATTTSSTPQPLAPGAPEFAESDIIGEATDSPGAADLFGLTRAEIDAFAPRDLIRLALERTAIEAIETEAEAGDPLGQALLCLSLHFGEGLEPDPAAARRACEEGAASNHPLALYMLSTFERAGDAGYAPNPGNIADADALLARAAQAGDPRARTDLARASLDAGEDAAARAHALAAAEQGYVPAQFLMGWMHEHGRGATRDHAQALQWYLRAGENGSPAGLRAVGVLYEAGEGVAQDFARARREYLRASELGDGEASQRLGAMCEQGLGAPRDMACARELYRRAVTQGYAAAQADIARIGPG